MKKDNKQILNEELNKFKKLLNYEFYDNLNESFSFHGERVEPKDLDDKEIIYGAANEAEEDEALNDQPMGDGEEINPDDSIETPEEVLGDEPMDNQPMDDTQINDEIPSDNATETGIDTNDGEVDLDVTELVNKTKEAKDSADNANSNIERLINMVDELQGKLEGMNQITQKIDALETELEKRVPTEEEKIQLRSMDSYPYNIKLSDFWADRQGVYTTNQEEEQEEGKDAEGNYVLTTKDVEDIDSTKIKDSFKDNPYEEEDIY